MRPFIVAALAVAAFAGLLYWWQLGRPVELIDVADDFVQCMSYSPYRRPGQSPLDADPVEESDGSALAPNRNRRVVISVPQIEADLAILSARTNCVRTYSVDQGLAEVPRIARKHGMKVLLGIWIGRDEKANEREMSLALDIIKRDEDVIKAVIVGNEVLLRHDQTPEALRAYIERVREATKLPVTYADVWEYWMRHRDLADAVSFVTVHILPYWEDEPAPIDLAIDHVQHVYERVAKTLGRATTGDKSAWPSRGVLIGEVGWPSAGRNREGAQPSLVNEARFIREFLAVSRIEKMDYNLIEAFDQPWKRKLEGTVGGYWGIYSATGEAKFPLGGPLAENRSWTDGLLAAAAGAVLLVLYCWLNGPQPGGLTVIALALGGMAAGATLMAQWNAFQLASRSTYESIITGFYSLCAALLALRVGLALNRWFEIGSASRPAPMGEIVHWFRTNADTYRTHERSLGWLRLVFLFGATVVNLLLVFDPRYRDFPIALYAIPACGFALLSWITAGRPHSLLRDRRPHAEAEENLLFSLLLPCAAWIAYHEGTDNPYAWTWSALCVLFSLSVIVPPVLARRRLQAGQSQYA